MSELSQQIDTYITNLFGPRYDHPLFDDIHTAAQQAGLPSISISASQGHLMHVLAKIVGARRILEIGSLGGYSGAWLASALPPDGKLITLELEAKHAEVARANFKRAGLDERVTVLVGPASRSLERLIAEKAEPFDIVFIDADKGGYVGYLKQALQLIRKGGIILGDNTLSGGVLDGDASSGIGQFNQAIAQEQSLTSAIVPVMKSHVDGLSISVVG
ncbi:MAG: O-methyltransferase [Capsulimonadaceae bacterium]|nr:O-methyltransferase [Capsulimonadaceae bacterium]